MTDEEDTPWTRQLLLLQSNASSKRKKLWVSRQHFREVSEFLDAKEKHRAGDTDDDLPEGPGLLARIRVRRAVSPDYRNRDTHVDPEVLERSATRLLARFKLRFRDVRLLLTAARSPTIRDYDEVEGIGFGPVWSLALGDNLKINIIESITDEPLDAVVRFHFTCVVAAWHADGIWLAYPELLKEHLILDVVRQARHHSKSFKPTAEMIGDIFCDAQDPGPLGIDPLHGNFENKNTFKQALSAPTRKRFNIYVDKRQRRLRANGRFAKIQASSHLPNYPAPFVALVVDLLAKRFDYGRRAAQGGMAGCVRKMRVQGGWSAALGAGWNGRGGGAGCARDNRRSGRLQARRVSVAALGARWNGRAGGAGDVGAAAARVEVVEDMKKNKKIRRRHTFGGTHVAPYTSLNGGGWWESEMERRRVQRVLYSSSTSALTSTYASTKVLQDGGAFIVETGRLDANSEPWQPQVSGTRPWDELNGSSMSCRSWPITNAKIAKL
ncbi:hypothetical protein R3P38DRAFT_2791901 [Favolaschia claudopus]|uniref:Uncharacterized protein n=1 Tax=Favolaschia claudopus TaxID=2862362 RepID=A0AAW0AGG3_9AGAR